MFLELRFRRFLRRIGGTSLYLQVLNLVWDSPEGRDELAMLREVGSWLEAHNAWAMVIDDPDWRPSLLGVAALMAMENTGQERALVRRIEARRSVIPQSVVALGLLHQGFALACLPNVAECHRAGAGRAAALYVLHRLGASDAGSRLAAGPDTRLSASQVEDWEEGAHLARIHWEFWRDVVRL